MLWEVAVIAAHYFIPGNAIIMFAFKGKIIEDRALNIAFIIPLSVLISIAINGLLALFLGNPAVGAYDITITTPTLLGIGGIFYGLYFTRVRLIEKR